MEAISSLQPYQKIDFPGTDEKTTFSVFGHEITVLPSTGEHVTGSSKVKLQNMVDYTWEERFYTGQLLAIHMCGKYIAYGIKAPGKPGGVVRVVNRETAERALIKGMEVMVQDIAFAHITTEIILAIVDQAGNLFVYRVEEKQQHQQSTILICELLLHVTEDSDSKLKGPYRVIWCPYLPDDEISSNNEDVSVDCARLVALTRGTKAEVWNVNTVRSLHGSGPVKPGTFDEGYLEITEHTEPIVDAAFSPDGTAIATTSLDGKVKFFQVFVKNEGKPRCLHQWQPHGGKPLSSLFFLDNRKHYSPDTQFWKFAITGANDNSELKLWSCESWTCLQTIHFVPRSTEEIKLKACLDLASRYLLLSDIKRRVLYILQIHKDSEDKYVVVQSISEFPLPYPILSFGIVDAGLRCFKSNSSFSLDDMCNGDGDEGGQVAIVVRMYLVQPKSLQECHIVFQTPKPIDRALVNTIPQDSLLEEYNDELPDLSASNIEAASSGAQELPPANHSSLQLNLMTPDAFNSPVKHDSPAASCADMSHAVTRSEPTYSNTTTLVASPQSPDEPDSKDDTVNNVLLGFASGGSSPSREVQEILSLKEAEFLFQDSDLQQQETEELTPPEGKSENNGWPEIPILRANDVRKNEEERSRSVTTNHDASTGAIAESQIMKTTQQLESTVTQLIHNMNTLVQTVEEQSVEMKELREELRRQNWIHEMDKIVSRNAQQHNTVIEKLLDSVNNHGNEEAIVSGISQSVNNIVSAKLEDIVQTEISNTIVPAILNQLEDLQRQIHIELTQKLSATDHLLKDNISKLVHSNSVMEVLSSSLATCLNTTIADCYREYFSSIAMPKFEKACSAMFTQINDTFSKGTKEYVNILETHTKRITEKNHDQNVQIQALTEVVKANSQQLANELKKAVVSIETNINEAMTKTLRAQTVALEGSVIAAVRSRAVTPAPQVDITVMQTQLLHLVGHGQINTAFQQALTAANLGLLEYLCLNVNPQQVFNQVPCPLEQPVLLSLIQQLASDMNNHTQLKYKYLEDAITNLDMTNPMTREHVAGVISHLQRHLQAFINNNPNNKTTRSMRILLMATHSLLDS